MLQGVHVYLTGASVCFCCPNGHYSKMQKHRRPVFAAQSGMPAQNVGACVPWQNPSQSVFFTKTGVMTFLLHRGVACAQTGSPYCNRGRFEPRNS